MNELIKISDNNGKKAVSARDLHEFLESKKDFSDWIKHRISKYGLVENIDFIPFPQIGEANSVTLRKEYALTIDAAKELSMVEGNSKGKQARQYFIECEKKLNNQISILSEAQMILNTLMVVQGQNKAIEAVEVRIKAIEQNQAIEIKQDYFTILAYCKRNHVQLSFSEAIQKGKIATRLSKEKGIDLRQVSDEKYGYVNSYKEDILKEAFQL